jgi:dTDP-4-amino-4,6-dideoxygalactose transaminase
VTAADLRPETLIPNHDLRGQYRAIRPKVDAAIAAVLESGEFERGEEIWAFERECAQFCGTAHAVGVGTGEAAVFLALQALGVGPGDEVITVPNTDISTCSAISHCGAQIVWADVDERTFNVDPARVAELIGPRTKAIIAVHLYGLPADMTALAAVADAHGVAIVEDAALAFGAAAGGRRVGGIGRVGCFSFAPHKILGAYGDGGLVTTNDPEVAAKVRLLAGYGEPFREAMAGPDGRLALVVEGYHSHLDLLQAAVLRVKLRHVGEWIEARQTRARLYDELLADSAVVTPFVPDDAKHVYRNYVVRIPHRDQVHDALGAHGIETALLYLPPLHLQPVYRALGYGAGSFPVAERLANELLCLPLYPELPDEAVALVARTLLAELERAA